VAVKAGVPHAALHLRRGKPSYTQAIHQAAQDAGHRAVGIARIAKETGLTRQTVYRIKGDPAGALAAWGM
jgi:putative DNA-invertase from lambdoid prophage Rac